MIKELPDNSVDCIYTDIPYLYNQGSVGDSDLSARTAKRKLELMGIDSKYLQNKTALNSEAIRIAKNAKKKNLDIISIEDGIDYSIFDDFVRVLKKINIFIWCSKLQIFDIMKYFMGGGVQENLL